MSCITEILKLKGDKDVLIPEGYLMAVKQCRDILKRIIKDVDDR